MKAQEIEKLLQLGEGPRVEFKAGSLNVAILGKVVCSFLNSGGGYIVYGVKEPGQILGVDITPAQIKSFEKQIHDGLSPQALVSFETQELEGKRILVIEVPAGKDVPYAFRDEIYIRADASTIRADVETIRDLVLRKQIEPERWERRFSFADLERDVDDAEVRAAVTASKSAGRAFFRDANDPGTVLEDLAVAKYGRLTNGGDVLFGRNPAERLPQVRVRAACFASDKASDTYRDMKSFEGPLVRVLEQAFEFIARNTPTTATFSPKHLQRRDRTLYPENAIREGLVNAFAHRDYANAAGGITVGVYPNRLEIWNSGSLPEGVTPEKLMAGHISVLRNPDIAHVLYLRGLMEKLGRGSMLILKSCADLNLPPPRWTSEANSGVTLTFHAAQATPPVTPHVTPQVAPQVTPQVGRLLAVLHGEMSRSRLMAALKIKDRKHFRESFLRTALDGGCIEMTQPDRPSSSTQRYRLTALGRAFLTKAAKGK